VAHRLYRLIARTGTVPVLISIEQNCQTPMHEKSQS
jgi:hypothetical protein